MKENSKKIGFVLRRHDVRLDYGIIYRYTEDIGSGQQI